MTVGNTIRNNPLVLWLALFIFRFLNAALVRTYFDPDEYWQSIEIAHRHVFGFGAVTWDWISGLRNWAAILPFIAAFRIVKCLGLGQSDRVVYTPRLIQAAIAASIDLGTGFLARRFYHREGNVGGIAKWALLMSVVSWFNGAYLVRTYTNVTESLLTVLALLKWPFDTSERISKRPSAVLNWIYPALMLLFKTSWPDRRSIVLLTVLAAGSVVAAGLLIDSYFYAQPTLSWWNFARLNYFESISKLYGTNSIFYYVLVALPTMTFTLLPLVALGAWSGATASVIGPNWLFGFAASSLWLNSMIAHKEIRFIIPLMPILLIWAGHGRILLRTPTRLQLKRVYLVVALISQSFLLFYMIRYHQKGPVQVMDRLRVTLDRYTHKHKHTTPSVLFLMPCHSVPWYGYLHRNVVMRGLDCSPPLNRHNGRYTFRPGYQDEADRFFADPVGQLPGILAQLGRANANPTHIVLYESLLATPHFNESLTHRYGYKPVWNTFNAHFSPDWRRKGMVMMFEQGQTGLFIEE